MKMADPRRVKVTVEVEGLERQQMTVDWDPDQEPGVSLVDRVEGAAIALALAAEQELATQDPDR